MSSMLDVCGCGSVYCEMRTRRAAVATRTDVTITMGVHYRARPETTVSGTEPAVCVSLLTLIDNENKNYALRPLRW